MCPHVPEENKFNDVNPTILLLYHCTLQNRDKDQLHLFTLPENRHQPPKLPTPGICLFLRFPVCTLSPVRLFAISWTIACQAPLSMGFPRQAYWSGLLFPSPWYLPTQGSNLSLLNCRQILYHLRYQGSPCLTLACS